MNDNLSAIENSQVQGQLLLDEPLSSYTTWRVGGIAKKLYKPANIDDLSLFLQQLPVNEPLVWLGLGSNCLIRDGGFAGTVVLTQGCLKEIQLLDETHVRVEAGVSCATMARFCARNNLGDAEFWAGIPGTMGGALRMNAGCFNSETWRSVVEVETISAEGVRRTRRRKEFEVTYRHIEGLESREWFIAATCEFPKSNKEKSLHLIKELLAHRANTQPTSEYNCGSVFKNPPGNYAAFLIESCGLKGKELGGAKVSTKHANFIINQDGQAKAKDIEALITLVRETVSQKTQIELVREVHIIGDF